MLAHHEHNNYRCPLVENLSSVAWSACRPHLLPAAISVTINTLGFWTAKLFSTPNLPGMAYSVATGLLGTLCFSLVASVYYASQPADRNVANANDPVGDPNNPVTYGVRMWSVNVISSVAVNELVNVGGSEGPIASVFEAMYVGTATPVSSFTMMLVNGFYPLIGAGVVCACFGLGAAVAYHVYRALAGADEAPRHGNNFHADDLLNDGL